MSKTRWQIATTVAVTWAIAASAIAWINKGQIETAAPVTTDDTELAELRRNAYTLQLDNDQLRDANQSLGKLIEGVAEKQSPSKCIGGTKFRTVNNALTNVGKC